MITCREAISSVVGELRSLGLDDRLSKRLVLSSLRDNVGLFIKQDTDQRRLFKINEIWKVIPCFELCSTDLIPCPDAPNCDLIMKSVKKLPSVFQSNYGNLIKIFTLDGVKEFKQIQPFEYKDIKNREYKDPNQRYFWVIDDYLYVPDSKIESVMVIGMFKFPHEVTSLIGGENCLSPLDEPFVCPDYLLSLVQDKTVEKFAKIYKLIIPDERPDSNVNRKN